MFVSKKLSKFKGIKHFFFNKSGGCSTGIYKSLNCGLGSKDKRGNVLKNLNIVSKKIGTRKIILPHQVHSNKIFFVKKIPKFNLIGDGLITNIKKTAIAVLTADCAPVIFYDKKKDLIGIAHAGWKGAYKKILKKMIEILLSKGSNLKDIYVVIGPCISQENYEIQIDFKRRFLGQSKKNKKYFKEINNKTYFDLKGYLYQQLINSGIKNIETIKKDTFNPKNNFFSARRSLKKKIDDYGRNISIIMIK
tara:strand:+ start:4467 stop:5213 length:747 start_codon:yes stop_codon:yes gene_type:complete